MLPAQILKKSTLLLDWLNTLFFLRSVALALKGAMSVSSHFANFQHFATFYIMATFQKLKDRMDVEGCMCGFSGCSKV